MKFSFIFIAVCILAIAQGDGFAQCVINTSDTITGFSPPALPCINQDSIYGQAVQVYVPASFGYLIDSVKLTGIGGLPSGISYSINPATGIIRGGGRACIWFSGATPDTLGTYNLIFSGTAYTSGGNFSLSQQPVSAIFSYALNVCPVPITVCDTLINIMSPLDKPEIYTLSGPNTGYASGNNSLGNIAYAENFSSPGGAHINGAFISFGYVTINHADSGKTITAYLWNNHGPRGTPGAALDSAVIPLGEIAAEVTESDAHHTPLPIYVSFASTTTITDTSFYVGVTVPNTGGDTVVLFTSNTDGGHDGKGWFEMVTDTGSSWYSYSGYWDYKVGNYIGAAFCATGNPPVAAFSATPQNTCPGDTVRFTDLSSNSPTSWLWTFEGGNPLLSITQNTHIIYNGAGAYNVKLVVRNFFGSDSVSQRGYIIINPNPGDSILNSTPASNAGTANGSVTVAGTNGTSSYTYKWSNGDTGATLSNVKPGDYSLTITDSYGCSSVANNVIVPVATGLGAVNANGAIKIYPNPTADEINIEWSTMPNAKISIIVMNGKTIRQFIAAGGLFSTFDLHDLPSGAYIIRITDRTTNQQQSAVFNKL